MLNLRWPSFSPKFSPNSFIVLALTHRSMNHFELLHIVSGRSPTSFFYIWISGCPSIICWKDNPFHIELSWHLCQKSIDHKCRGLILDSQFYSIDLYVYSYTRTTFPDCCSFLISSQIGNMSPQVLLFFFKIILAITDSLCWILGSTYTFLQKKVSRDFGGDCTESVDQLGGTAILTILILPVHKHIR